MNAIDAIEPVQTGDDEPGVYDQIIHIPETLNPGGMAYKVRVWEWDVELCLPDDFDRRLIVNMAGCLNEARMTGKGRTWEPGRVLLATIKSEPKAIGEGQIIFRAVQLLTFRFLGRERDWNDILRPDGIWRPLLLKGEPIYRRVDFRRIPGL